MAKDIQCKVRSNNNVVERLLLTFDSAAAYGEAIRRCREKGFIRFENGGPHVLLGRPVRVSDDDRAIEVDAAADFGLSLAGAGERGHAAKVRDVTIEHGRGASLQAAVARSNCEAQRKHEMQTLLLTKGFLLLGWTLAVFVYWLLFHDSVRGILRALIGAAG